MNLIAQAKKVLPSPVIDTLRPLYWKMYAWRKYAEEMDAKGLIPKNGIFARISIETYAYCNRKCSFCFNNDRFPKRERGVMSTGVFEKIVEELASINFTGTISLNGYGEPLLDKRLPELVSFAREKCPYAEIMFPSNGDFLTEELLSKLLKNGLDYILISNYDDFEKPNLVELCEKYPAHIKYRNFNIIQATNCGGVIFNRRNAFRCRPCLHPLVRVAVHWQGHIVLCCNDYYEKHVFGNVKNESILEVWNSDKFNEYKRILKRGDRAKVDICRNCDELTI